MEESFVGEFISPGSEYRGILFWGLNNKLEPDELRRQIRVMHRMGMGGFFIHSRVGLKTPYLSDEWFACVRACIDEAKKLDMKAWLYDEDRWPSGSAGGLVTKGVKYRARRLVLHEFRNAGEFRWQPQILAAFTATVKGSTARDVRQLPRGRKPARLRQGQSILAFRVRVDPDNDMFNGGGSLDTLNHDAVREFIRVTHEAYRKRVGEFFGDVVPGIFTDEPSFLGIASGTGKPGDELHSAWTDKLPKLFRGRYGYDLIPHLPEIFLDIDGQEISRARYHYLDCVTFLFANAYCRQIADWCAENDLLMTGHMYWEESLSSQTNAIGSLLRCLEPMQAPGQDILIEHLREYDTPKCVSSAARQFGRKWRLSETYGSTGWDFSFLGHKAISDWQAALGINFRSQHLAWYSMEGPAKRDYPAAISDQSPWWKLYPKVEDYFARIHVAMTQGVEVRDLLVIFPIESMWLRCKKGWYKTAATKRHDRMLVILRDALLKANIDFDYGDEEILSRHGKVRVARDEARLHVARAPYKAVLVPPMKTMRSTTLSLLKRFQRHGGPVIFAGLVARYVDAERSNEVLVFARECRRAPFKEDQIVATVEPTCRRVSITDRRGHEIETVLHLLREDKDAFYLFICNTGHTPQELKPQVEDPTMVRDRKAAFPDVRIRGFTGCKGRPVELCPDSGNMFLADASADASGWEIRTSLPPCGSRLFVIPKSRRLLLPAQKRVVLKKVRGIPLRTRQWEFALSECNNLVLDHPRYRIGDGGMRNEKDILGIDDAVRKSLGLPRRWGLMVQPWARPKPKHARGLPVTLEYTFAVKEMPASEIFLGIENPRLYEMRVNDAELPADAKCGWWTDRSLRKIPIDPSTLKPGRNTITLTCDYDSEHPGLECIYLLGNFGAEVRGTRVAITALPRKLKMGDWVRQGLPFYSGSVAYVTTIAPKLRKRERLFVRVPEYRGTCVRMLVDGREAGIIGWEPNEVELTDFVGNGRAELRIQVVGHRRNSHGPLHYFKKWPYWCAGDAFAPADHERIDAYQLVPCGLMKPPSLIVRAPHRR